MENGEVNSAPNAPAVGHRV